MQRQPIAVLADQVFQSIDRFRFGDVELHSRLPDVEIHFAGRAANIISDVAQPDSFDFRPLLPISFFRCAADKQKDDECRNEIYTEHRHRRQKLGRTPGP